MGWRALALGLFVSQIAGCERTVASDADCEGWYNTCGGCAQQCTPSWEVDEAATLCDLACEDPLPACVADLDAGTCVFED